MMAAMDSLWSALAGLPWYAWIAIIAIVGGTIRSIVAMNHKHQERIEMIRQGMDPRNPK